MTMFEKGTMKGIAFVLVLMFLTVGAAYGKGLDVRKPLGDFEVLVRLDRFPVIQGDNPIEVELKDPQGKAITNAKVLINYYMPPMPRMAPMNYKTEGRLSGSKYKTSMNIIMAGPWIIRILITRNEKTSLVKINVDAQ
jgi:hypothetical protein